MAIPEIFSFTNPACNAYAFYCSVLVLKILLMSVLTGQRRMTKKSFANPEDGINIGGKVRIDEDVERIRRAHLNDLENIPVFMFISALYLLTGPAASTAVNLIRLFTLARVAHTIVYAIVVIPQPARSVSWGIGISITVYMAIKTMIHFAAFM